MNCWPWLDEDAPASTMNGIGVKDVCVREGVRRRLDGRLQELRIPPAVISGQLLDARVRFALEVIAEPGLRMRAQPTVAVVTVPPSEGSVVFSSGDDPPPSGAGEAETIRDVVIAHVKETR